MFFLGKTPVDYIVESIKIMAAFSSCEGSVTLFCYLTEYLTESEAVVKLEYLPLLATP